MIIASAFTISLGSVDSEASQWNNSTIEQAQSNSGWTKFIQTQQKEINSLQSEYSGSKGTVGGQAVTIKGFQLQSGKSDGPAAANQSEERTMDVGNEQDGNTTTTSGSAIIEQSTVTSSPAYVLQAQNTTNTIFHFQGSIEGGPTIQNQISQTNSYQFSTAITK